MPNPSPVLTDAPEALSNFATPSSFESPAGGIDLGPVDDRPFKVMSDFAPAGDQPKAIAKLTEGVLRGDRFQFLDFRGCRHPLTSCSLTRGSSSE